MLSCSQMLTISAAVCLLGTTIVLLAHSSSIFAGPLSIPSSQFSEPSPQQVFSRPFSFAEFHERVPYVSSWGSWLHPQRHHGAIEQSEVAANIGKGQGGGEIADDWNILYHLGGNGPWIEKVDGVVEGGIGVPEGCRVGQIHMMSRHAERYPTVRVGLRMIDLVHRIRSSNITLQGDLAFANNWTYFSSDPQRHLEQLTSTGPYAGTLEAFTTGVKLRTRYPHLLSSRLAHGKTNLWASDSKRVSDTARYFSAGLFGLDWKDTARLHIIPETADLGADTLTPGDTCLHYNTDKERGHDYGAAMLLKYRSTYLPVIADRLEEQNPTIRFTEDEIYAMQELCGFETTVRGSSPWCDVFSKQEWENYEYARDVIHYYRAGPGNQYGAVMGWLWLNATANLMEEGETAGPMFFSFVHDGDIVPMLAALDIFHDEYHLPITHAAKNRKWRTSQVTPMGGRIIFERLACSTSHTSLTASSSGPHASPTTAVQEEIYVRININDGIVAMPDCSSGPGRSCPLRQFLQFVKRRGEETGDFRAKCGLNDTAADRITFLHQ